MRVPLIVMVPLAEAACTTAGLTVVRLLRVPTVMETCVGELKVPPLMTTADKVPGVKVPPLTVKSPLQLKVPVLLNVYEPVLIVKLVQLTLPVDWVMVPPANVIAEVLDRAPMPTSRVAAVELRPVERLSVAGVTPLYRLSFPEFTVNEPVAVSVPESVTVEPAPASIERPRIETAPEGAVISPVAQMSRSRFDAG